jgi:hypothetical protein
MEDFFSGWMRHIVDDAPVTRLVMPGSHNAGSYGMPRLFRCQNDTLDRQVEYGVRHFCIRLSSRKNGRVEMAHHIARGEEFESAMEKLARAIDAHPTEFFILDIRKYYPSPIGITTLHFRGPAELVDPILARTIDPEKNALRREDFPNLSRLTMGDLRRSGKRYLLLNYENTYRYSYDWEQIFPFDRKLHGNRTEIFARDCVKFFDTCHTNGIYWFQTQQTPDPFTKVGLTSPDKLDRLQIPYFKSIIDAIRGNPRYLEQANVISCDFVTRGYKKAKLILRMNLDKGFVRPESVAIYRAAVALTEDDV